MKRNYVENGPCHTGLPDTQYYSTIAYSTYTILI